VLPTNKGQWQCQKDLFRRSEVRTATATTQARGRGWKHTGGSVGASPRRQPAQLPPLWEEWVYSGQRPAPTRLHTAIWPEQRSGTRSARADGRRPYESFRQQPSRPAPKSTAPSQRPRSASPVLSGGQFPLSTCLRAAREPLERQSRRSVRLVATPGAATRIATKETTAVVAHHRGFALHRHRRAGKVIVVSWRGELHDGTSGQSGPRSPPSLCLRQADSRRYPRGRLEQQRRLAPKQESRPECHFPALPSLSRGPCRRWTRLDAPWVSHDPKSCGRAALVATRGAAALLVVAESASVVSPLAPGPSLGAAATSPKIDSIPAPTRPVLHARVRGRRGGPAHIRAALRPPAQQPSWTLRPLCRCPPATRRLRRCGAPLSGGVVCGGDAPPRCGSCAFRHAGGDAMRVGSGQRRRGCSVGPAVSGALPPSQH